MTWLVAGAWFGDWFGALEAVESTSDGLGYVDRIRVAHAIAGERIHAGSIATPMHCSDGAVMHSASGQTLAVTRTGRIEYESGEVAAATIRRFAGYTLGHAQEYIRP